VLLGRIGEVLVTARRKGLTWYVGAITAGPARDVEVPFAFLGAGSFQATVWKDSPDAAADPNR
jgi:alpha-glucosidase